MFDTQSPGKHSVSTQIETDSGPLQLDLAGLLRRGLARGC